MTEQEFSLLEPGQVLLVIRGLETEGIHILVVKRLTDDHYECVVLIDPNNLRSPGKTWVASAHANYEVVC